MAQRATAVRTTKRTTAPKARRNVINLDAEIEAELEDDDAPVKTKVIEILGEEFTVRCRLNQYLIEGALGGDFGATHKLYQSIMSPEDYFRFDALMASHPNMTAARLNKIFAKLIETVSERPTS